MGVWLVRSAQLSNARSSVMAPNRAVTVQEKMLPTAARTRELSPDRMAGKMGADPRPETRITRIRSRVLDLPLPADFRPAWGRNEIQRSFYVTLVEVETAGGVVGVTAAEAGPEAAVSIGRFVTPHLIGQGAARPESLIRVMREAEILGSAVYCGEVALWDLARQIARLSVR